MKHRMHGAAVALSLLVLLAAAAPALAQPYPSVSSLEPFSAATNYMSLAGYLRWLIFQEKAEWLTPAEATRIVNEQTGTIRQ